MSAGVQSTEHADIAKSFVLIKMILLVLPQGTAKMFHREIFQNCKNKTAVKLTAVSCPPVVEVKIKRPDTKYQLGFSVQNGVVSLSSAQEHFISFTFYNKLYKFTQNYIPEKKWWPRLRDRLDFTLLRNPKPLSAVQNSQEYWLMTIFRSAVCWGEE